MEDLTTYSRVDTLGTTTSVAEIHVFTYDASGPTWLDDTLDANSSGASDLLPIPSVAEADPEGDITYYGCMGQFAYLSFTVATAGVFHNAAHEAQTAGVVWEYWNGAWTDLAETDGTTGYTAAAGTRTVTWTGKTDWLTTEINNLTMYWVRSRYATADHHVNTAPVITQVQRGGGLFIQPSRVRFTGTTSAASPILSKVRATDKDDEINDYFSVTIDALTGETTSTGIILWEIADSADPLANNSLAFGIYEWSTPDKNAFNMFQRNADVGHTFDATYAAYEFTLNRRYWVHINYLPTGGSGGGARLRAYVYSDRERTTLVHDMNWDVQAVTGHAHVDCTHFVLGSYGAGAASVVAGEYYWNATPTSTLAESDVAIPMNWTDEPANVYPGDPVVWTESGDAGHIAQGEGAWSDWLHLFAVDADDDIGGAYFVPSSNTLGLWVIEGTFHLDSADEALPASHYLRCLFATDGTHIAYASVYNNAGTKYWVLQTSDVNHTASPVVCAYDTEYQVKLTIGWGIAAAGIDLTASLYVKGGACTEWTYCSSAQVDAAIIHIHANRVGVGSNTTGAAGYAGCVYAKDIKYKDGTTYFPKVCYGGAGDNTLVYTHRVGESHMSTYAEYIEVFANEVYQSAIGPTADYDYRMCIPVWDGTNWWLFVHRAHSTPYYDTVVYKTTDLTNLGSVVATIDHSWVWPTKMIETWGGKTVVLCGIETDDIENVAYPSAATQYVEFGHFELGDDYTLTRVAKIASYGDLIAANGCYEPFIFRNLDDSLACLLRWEDATPTARDIYLHVDSSGVGTAWSVGAWPGEDWSDISACLCAFMFRDYLWVMGRDTQITAGPWQQVVWKCDGNTLGLVAERTWGGLPYQERTWEVGNGWIDARDGQTGQFTLAVAFGLGLAMCRTVGSGLLATARKNMLLSNF